jgi:hypothetical protein
LRSARDVRAIRAAIEHAQAKHHRPNPRRERRRTTRDCHAASTLSTRSAITRSVACSISVAATRRSLEADPVCV